MKIRLHKIRELALGIVMIFLISCTSALAENITQNTISTWEETFFNEMETFHITVEKRDAKTNDVLAGAIFGLYTEEDMKTADGTVAVAAGTLLETIVTDENGKASFTTKYPRGTYRVEEIKAPNGYKTANDQVISLKDDLKLIFYNKWSGGTITAIKKIPISSNYEPHGAETFIFHLSGMDNMGNEHNYYKSVTLSEECSKSVDGNYYVLSATFDELVLGTYTLSEIETIRYGVQSIQEISANGIAVEKNVTFEITLNNLEGSATFINEKVVWDDYSHTDCVVNIISE
ncbi:MAG: hypothetical protein E7269_01990 [Lachnospiraceae bacterium]|nr:hypothetical protein [Lachnospiraceae bacterium]